MDIQKYLPEDLSTLEINLSDEDLDLSEIFAQLEAAETPREKRIGAARMAAIETSLKYLTAPNRHQLFREDLKPTQKLAALGYFHWLCENILIDRKLGKIIKPPGAGKTGTAIILSEMTPGRYIFVAETNGDADASYLEFERHFQGRKSISRNFGGHKESQGDVMITTFNSVDEWWGPETFSGVGGMTIDEADISALSDKRQKLILDLAQAKAIPIVAMSATEEQGSGKKINDVFTDDIFSLSMPQALPLCRKMDITPNMEFRDIYLDATLPVNLSRLRKSGDLGDNAIRQFIFKSGWNDKLLDCHLENFPGQVGIVGYRDNALNEDFIERAAARGLKAVQYTGETDEDTRRLYRDTLGEDIDFIVGSGLIGRALDIPRAQSK